LIFAKDYVIYTKLEKLSPEEYMLNLAKNLEMHYNEKSLIKYGILNKDGDYTSNYHQYQIHLPFKVCITNLANIIFEILPDFKIDILQT